MDLSVRQGGRGLRVICVDDERLIMEETMALCLKIPEIQEVKGFTKAKEALEWLEDNAVDLALLDIDMPGINGIEVAYAIKQKQPETAIIFLTGYAEYAVDAFKVRAKGYLLKPVTQQQLKEEIEYVLKERKNISFPHVMIKTFGNFDVFVDGNLVTFKMAKSKELLAYLVDKQGSSATRKEAFAVLWEDRMYDRSMQKQLDVVIRRLRTTLNEYRIGEIFDMKTGSMRVCPDKFTCDIYQFIKGDPAAINEYRGEYMTSYSWASLTESYISWKIGH